MHEVLSYTAWSLAGVVVAYFALQFFWRARGSYKVWRAEPRPLFGARHRLWRDPGNVERLDLTSGPGGPSQAPVAPYQFIEEHSSGSQPTHLRARRERAALAREVGTRGPARDLRGPPVVGVRLLRRGHAFRRARDDPRRRSADARGVVRGPGGIVRRRALRARRSGRREAVRGAQLVVDRQSVCRHAGARGPEDRPDADLELGQQGSARRGARVEHRDLRHARVALEARGAVPDRRLGRVDGKMGRDHRHARPLGSRRASRRRRRSS